MALEKITVLRRAKCAYEIARVKTAFVGCLPIALLATMYGIFGVRSGATLWLIVALTVLAVVLLWRGMAAGQGVLLGSFAGLIPLGLALGARSFGHVCTGNECLSFCVPACTCGGILAGFLIARAGRRSAHPIRFFASAALLASLVGSLGCSCVGYGGVVGLVAGLVVTIIPHALARQTA